MANQRNNYLAERAETKFLSFGESGGVDPDLEIIYKYCGYHVFRLHSQVLRSSSTFFYKSLGISWLKGEVTDSGPIKYRYIMMIEFPDEYDPEYPFKSTFAPTRDNNILKQPFHDAEQTQLPSGLIAVTNMLHCLYGSKPDIKETRSAMFLIDLAVKFECLALIAPLLESVLHEGEHLHVCMRSNPLHTMLIAAKLRSKSLFRDAFVCGVGKLLKEGSDQYGGDLRFTKLPRYLKQPLLEEYQRITVLESKVLGEIASKRAKWVFIPSSIEELISLLSHNDRSRRVEAMISLFKALQRYKDLNYKESNLFYEEYRQHREMSGSRPLSPTPTIQIDSFVSYTSLYLAMIPLLRCNLRILCYKDFCHDSYLCAELNLYPWEVVEMNNGNNYPNKRRRISGRR